MKNEEFGDQNSYFRNQAWTILTHFNEVEQGKSIKKTCFCDQFLLRFMYLWWQMFHILSLFNWWILNICLHPEITWFSNATNPMNCLLRSLLQLTAVLQCRIKNRRNVHPFRVPSLAGFDCLKNNQTPNCQFGNSFILQRNCWTWTRRHLIIITWTIRARGQIQPPLHFLLSY